MKVLQLNMHRKGGWGGQPNRVLVESLEVRARGHEVVIGGPHENELCVRAKQHGFETFDELDLRSGLPSYRDVRAVRSFVTENEVELVHTHGSQDTWAAALALRGLRDRTGFVRSRHNSYPIATHPFNRWLYRKIDHVIVVAPQVGEYIVSLGLKESDDITAVFSVPDFKRFSSEIDPAPLREELGLQDKKVIVCAARLAPEKGHEHLLQAFARVCLKLPNARLVLAGKGRQRERLQGVVAQLGIAEKVLFVGFRTDVELLDALADVFCITPTNGEAICTSALEALCSGTPVVATDVSGVSESVLDGETGFLHDVGDVQGVAASLIKILEDEELRMKMGRRGREHVKAKFTLEQLGERTVEVYERVMATKRGT